MITLAEAIAQIARMRAALPGLLVQAVQHIGDDVAKDLHDGSPIGAQSPHLADSFHALTTGGGFGGSEASVVVQSDQGTKLAWVVEGTGIYGPRNHRIVPITKQALYWEGAAHPYRSIAGMRPRDFVTPAIAQADGHIEEELTVLEEQLLAL